MVPLALHPELRAAARAASRRDGRLATWRARPARPAPARLVWHCARSLRPFPENQKSGALAWPARLTNDLPAVTYCERPRKLRRMSTTAPAADTEKTHKHAPHSGREPDAAAIHIAQCCANPAPEPQTYENGNSGGAKSLMARVLALAHT
jgi:hypothetical protein